jgi:hypothetical protein
VFEISVLWRIFVAKRKEVAGGWRKLHNEELQILHVSANIIRIIKLRRMIMARYVTRTSEMRNAFKILVGKPEGRNHAEDLGVDDNILEWILGKLGGKVWTGFFWLRTETSGGLWRTRQ